jgi:two-component system chemotaxis response regulator CheB
LFKTYEALSAGAVDVLEKPNGREPEGAWERQFLSTLKLVSRIRVITHPRARLGSMGKPTPRAPHAEPLAHDSRAPLKVAAIGASTGGPGAIVDVLRGLPRDFTLPLLLVLHIGEAFGAAFADWLDGQTDRRVHTAREGEAVAAAAGQVIMAPPGKHMILHQGKIRLTSDPERHSCRPSVDVLFESVAQTYGPSAVGCLLTGMGRDGAEGLLAMRKAGGRTLAQDEATCVVYGMPREAALIGAVECVLPLDQIGPTLAELGRSGRLRA